MGRGWVCVWTCAVGLLLPPTASAAPAELGPTRPLETRDADDLPRLRTVLARREQELEAARGRLRAIDDAEALLDRAGALGILEVLRSSMLTESAQRRVAMAIVREADANGVDPLLVVAIIRTESAFEPDAISGMGAMGLMQMMPTTGTALARRRGTALRHVRTLFDAELNIELGTSYLAALLREFGTTEDALVAYNAGPKVAHWMLRNPGARSRFVAGYPRSVLVEWRRLLARRPEAPPASVPSLVAERRLTAPP